MRKQLLIIFIFISYIVLVALIFAHIVNKSKIFIMTPSINLAISILVGELLLSINKDVVKEKLIKRIEMKIAYVSILSFFLLEIWSIYLFIKKEISTFFFFALAMSVAMAIGYIAYRIGKILFTGN